MLQRQKPSGGLSCLAIVLFALVATTARAQTLPNERDWRTWPFSERSPWNHPIGSGATYAAVRQIASYPTSINHDGKWTVAIHVARTGDPHVSMRFGPAWGTQSLWGYLDRGGRNCNLSASAEQSLLRNATSTLAYDANYYSTIAAPDDSRWVLPPDYRKARDGFRSTFQLPAGACPSPDSDSFMAVFQPDGWVLDIFATVVTSQGVLGTMASYIDARGDGTGWSGGRRASMLPSFAGLIRTGELAAGRIPHALAVQVPASLLKEQVVWPAYAFDRNNGYSGVLPMGALLAIPPSVDIDRLELSAGGRAIARAAQDYGVYVVDRGGSGINFMAELGDPDIRWERGTSESHWWQDIKTIKNLLQRVTNNGPTSIGGGGTPRAPFAPPFAMHPPSAPVLQ